MVASTVLLIGLMVTLPQLLLFFELPLLPENTLSCSPTFFFLVIVGLISCTAIATARCFRLYMVARVHCVNSVAGTALW